MKTYKRTFESLLDELTRKELNIKKSKQLDKADYLPEYKVSKIAEKYDRQYYTVYWPYYISIKTIARFVATFNDTSISLYTDSQTYKRNAIGITVVY